MMTEVLVSHLIIDCSYIFILLLLSNCILREQIQDSVIEKSTDAYLLSCMSKDSQFLFFLVSLMWFLMIFKCFLSVLFESFLFAACDRL